MDSPAAIVGRDTPRGSWGESVELVAMALAAELVFLVVAFVPLTPFVGATAVFYGPKAGSIAGVLLLSGVWWLLQRRAAEPEGQSVPPGSPLLHEIDSLCAKVGAPRIHRIVLDDSFNAAAATSRGFLSLVGVRRTLVLGVPLLRLLEPQEVRAVIAHELGHFSREHGRMGHWIYLVRSKWEQYLHDHDTDRIDDFLRLVAGRFVPMFLRRSSAWSLRCEYEADATAARVVGSASLASALGRVEAVAASLREEVRAELRNLCRASAEPVADYWKLVHETAARSPMPSRSAPRRRMYDTHPSLQERLQPFGLQPQPPAWEQLQPAGPEWLGTTWEPLVADVQRRWEGRVRRNWHLDHVRLRSLARRLHASATAGERAVAEEQLAPTPATLRQLRATAAAQPRDATLAFALGTALLDRDDASGCDTLRSAARLDSRLAPAASALVARFRREHGTDEEAARAARQAAHAERMLAPVLHQLRERLLHAPRAAKEVDREALRESVMDTSLIDGAWLLATDLMASGLDWRAVVLVLRVDSRQMLAAAGDEDQIARDWTDLLEGLVPPGVVAHVHTVLTTEPLNPRLLQRLQAIGNSCLKPPQQPLNEGLVKLDSL